MKLEILNLGSNLCIIIIAALEGKKLMTTRSKTGSLTPKIYTDSVTITTNASKVSSKNTEELLLMNKDGEITRVTTRRSVTTNSLASQSLYFKLGECVEILVGCLNQT